MKLFSGALDPSSTVDPEFEVGRVSDETDPNKLHDLQANLDGAQVHTPKQVEDFVRRYLDGAERDQLDPILDTYVAVYLRELDEDGQVEFKGTAGTSSKGGTRRHGLPFNSSQKRSNPLYSASGDEVAANVA